MMPQGSTLPMALVAAGLLVAALGPGPVAAAAPSRIVFTDAVGEHGQAIFAVRSGGRDRVQLTDGSPVDSSPSWSRRQRRIVFSRLSGDEPDLLTSLFTIDADGSRLRPIARTRHAIEPSWSPTGRRIAFAKSRYGNDYEAAIFTIRPDGTGLRRLTRYRGATEPAWSPNGKAIAYSTRGGAIARMRANGKRRRVVTRDGYAPDWSPRGGRIAFWNGDGEIGDILTVRTNGSRRRVVTRDSLDCPPGEGPFCFLHPTDPAWSPTAGRIAFANYTFDPDRDELDPDGIWTMRPDGTRAHRVTRSGEQPDW